MAKRTKKKAVKKSAAKKEPVKKAVRKSAAKKSAAKRAPAKKTSDTLKLNDLQIARLEQLAVSAFLSEAQQNEVKEMIAAGKLNTEMQERLHELTLFTIGRINPNQSEKKPRIKKDFLQNRIKVEHILQRQKKSREKKNEVNPKKRRINKSFLEKKHFEQKDKTGRAINAGFNGRAQIERENKHLMKTLSAHPPMPAPKFKNPKRNK